MTKTKGRRDMTPRGGTPQLTFRQGRLGPKLRARVGTSDDATSVAQVAQRDLGRYYALLEEGLREAAAGLDTAAARVAWTDLREREERDA